MHPIDYQSKALEHAKYSVVDYPFLALAEEAGEVMGKLAKFSRKNDMTLTQSIVNARYGNDELLNSLKSELGDVLWQLAACCKELGTNLNELQHSNLQKLSGRDARGTIVGEGDER